LPCQGWIQLPRKLLESFELRKFVRSTFPWAEAILSSTDFRALCGLSGGGKEQGKEPRAGQKQRRLISQATQPFSSKFSLAWAPRRTKANATARLAGCSPSQPALVFAVFQAKAFNQPTELGAEQGRIRKQVPSRPGVMTKAAAAPGRRSPSAASRRPGP